MGNSSKRAWIGALALAAAAFSFTAARSAAAGAPATEVEWNDGYAFVTPRRHRCASGQASPTAPLRSRAGIADGNRLRQSVTTEAKAFFCGAGTHLGMSNIVVWMRFPFFVFGPCDP